MLCNAINPGFPGFFKVAGVTRLELAASGVTESGLIVRFSSSMSIAASLRYIILETLLFRVRINKFF